MDMPLIKPFIPKDNARATLQEFGSWHLSMLFFIPIYAIISFVLFLISIEVLVRYRNIFSDLLGFTVILLIPIGFIYCLIRPTISIIIRRLHDTGKSGWFALFLLIPIFGILIVYYFCLEPTQQKDNQWGSYHYQKEEVFVPYIE